MARRMTSAQIEAQRKADRAARLAQMSERDLAAYAVEIANELNDNRMDYRLKLNHFDIRDGIRAELAARRNPSALAA